MSQTENKQLAVPQGHQTAATPGALKLYLEKSRQAVVNALPKHLNPDRMLRLTLTSFSTTPKLRECSVQSILASIVVAAQLGLEPGITGQGYLIPYKGTCTFVPGWQGLVGLLNNSGRATAWTGAVFAGDTWEFELGSKPKCKHIPGENYGDPAHLIWVYACGQVNGSEMPVIEAWPISRVWKHRDRFNKVGDKHYSFQHPEMYARKVVLLQVLKYMPKSIELSDALTVANADDSGRIATRNEDGAIVIQPEASDIPADPVFEDKPAEEPKPQKPIHQPAATVQQTPAQQASSTLGFDDAGDRITTLCEGAEIAPEELLGWARKATLISAAGDFAELNLAKRRRIIDDFAEVRKQIEEARPPKQAS